jgi:hypothetical protein
MVTIAVISFALIFPRNNSAHRATEVGVLFLLAALAAVLVRQSYYWELSPQCLLLHKLWKRKQIPWNEVTSVGWLRRMSGTFRINIGHQIEDYDRLYIEPSNQAAFIVALREFAPHADFELE